MEKNMTPCKILYEDESLLFVDKTSGLLSHPNPAQGTPDGKKKQKACAFYGDYNFEKRCFQTPNGPLWLIHRLDQEASGVLLAAKTKEAAERCRGAFENNKVEKYYITLLLGSLRPPKGKWCDHISVQRKKKFVRSTTVKSRPMNAVLHYTLKSYFPRFRLSFVEIKLVTGKTHQIRIQAATHHYPIAGDEVYGQFAVNRNLRKEIGLRRLFLHASSMALPHPVTGKTINVQSPIPQELEESLSRA